jgi:2-isopropylmalate synthase
MRAMDVDIYDTTLRDGAQTEGISLSCDDKIRIAKQLDEFGVRYIEGGWPGSNPKDIEFFERARDMDWKTARIAAFGSTRRRDIAPEDDANLIALLDVSAPVCTLVGKTWGLHVTQVLQTTPDENLRMIEESIAFLHSHGREVVYDAEHFFDGYNADASYALATLQAAAQGGATALVLCDTNGGSLPWDVEKVVREVVQAMPGVRFGIHCHNDAELAVANSLAAVRAGARHVQGTINGYGERCGNGNLCAIIPDLEIKLGLTAVPEGSLAQLFDLSNYVAEVANQGSHRHMAYVGRSAFAHKGGIHVAAMRRDERAYQHIDPALVGNQMRVVVSELSGRGNLLSKAEELGVEVDGSAQLQGALAGIKELEAQGFAFEAADASVALLLARQSEDYEPMFRLIDYTVMVEHRQGRGTLAEATVKVDVKGQRVHTAAEGSGPVQALDRALRKALLPTYPALGRFHLVDYKVRILNSDTGTAATTRVLIDTRDDTRRWTTVGASDNIIEASWRALSDSIEYGLRKEGERKKQKESPPQVEARLAETNL